MAGTRQAMTELLARSVIKKQGEAITLMIHHTHALRPKSQPRHWPRCDTLSSYPKTCRWLFHCKSLLKIGFISFYNPLNNLDLMYSAPAVFCISSQFSKSVFDLM